MKNPDLDVKTQQWQPCWSSYSRPAVGSVPSCWDSETGDSLTEVGWGCLGCNCKCSTNDTQKMRVLELLALAAAGTWQLTNSFTAGSCRLRNFSSVADSNANYLAYHVNFGGFFIIIIYTIFFADTEQKDIFARWAFFFQTGEGAVLLLITSGRSP